MANWYIQLLDGEIVYLKIVRTLTFDSPHSIIVYEYPGSNGGSIKNNGRMNESCTLNINLVGKDLNEVQNSLFKLRQIKNSGESIRLVAPLQFSETGRFQIGNITGGLDEGAYMNSIITLTLIEDREVSSKVSEINLVSYQPFEEFKQLYLARTAQQQ